MCLLSGQRSETLAFLCMNHMFLGKTKCIFYTSKLLKTSHPRFFQNSLEFKIYPDERTVCVVRIIKAYLQKTEMHIHTDDSLFCISYVPPHKVFIT